MVDYFCREALAGKDDVIIGLASHEAVIQRFPETKRTAARFRDGSFCSCNLFAFLTDRSRAAAKFWQKLEGNRKKPWRIMKTIGWPVVLRYLSGGLSLGRGLERISQRMGISAGAVILPFPEAAVDVDTIRYWHLVEDFLGKDQ